MEEIIEHRELDLSDSKLFNSKLPHETIPLKATWLSIGFDGILHKKIAVWNWPFDLDCYSEMFIDAGLHGTHDFIERLPSPLSIMREYDVNKRHFYERSRSSLFKILLFSILNFTDFEFATMHELWLEANGFKYEIVKNNWPTMAWKIAI